MLHIVSAQLKSTISGSIPHTLCCTCIYMYAKTERSIIVYQNARTTDTNSLKNDVYMIHYLFLAKQVHVAVVSTVYIGLQDNWKANLHLSPGLPVHTTYVQ